MSNNIEKKCVYKYKFTVKDVWGGGKSPLRLILIPTVSILHPDYKILKIIYIISTIYLFVYVFYSHYLIYATVNEPT